MIRSKLIRTGALLLFMIFAASPIAAQQAANGYYREGAAAAQRGDRAGALEGYSKSALSADRGGAVAYHNMGNNYEKRGDIKNALVSYEEAVRRNPAQIESIERCVYLHHSLGNWRQAIYYGETGVRVDPLNRRIPPLLLDAYAKEREGKNFYSFDKEHKFERKAEGDFRIEIGAKGAAGISADDGVSFIQDPLTLTPFYLSGRYNYTKKISFLLKIENPDNGSLLEDTVFLSERLEFLWRSKNSAIGGGIFLNHYCNDNYTENRLLLHDIKLGFLYRYVDDKNDLDLAWYPRLLPSDMSQIEGASFDANMLSLNYAYAYNSFFDILTGFKWREYVFYNHTDILSDYEGICDITGGLRFFNNARSNNTITTTMTDRLYLRDRGNTHPYDSLNGQGFFGINTGKWFKGDPLSGYRTNSYLLGFRFDQFTHSPFGIYEKLEFEIVMPSKKRHAVSIEIGGRGDF